MSLTNAEYNQIMREYEKKQAYDEREFIVRRDSVYQNYPALKEIDHKISNLGVFYTKKYISGDLHARDEMHAELDRLNSENQNFYRKTACQTIFWRNIIPARTAKIPASLEISPATALFRQK